MHNICSDFNETLKADSFMSQSLRVLYVCRIGIFTHPMTLIEVTPLEGTISLWKEVFILFVSVGDQGSREGAQGIFRIRASWRRCHKGMVNSHYNTERVKSLPEHSCVLLH